MDAKGRAVVGEIAGGVSGMEWLMVVAAVDEGSIVKLSAREVVEIVGVFACAWFPDASGVTVVDDKAAGTVGTVEGRFVLCGVVVEEGAMGTLLAVIWGLTVGAEVRGSAAGGGG